MLLLKEMNAHFSARSGPGVGLGSKDRFYPQGPLLCAGSKPVRRARPVRWNTCGVRADLYYFAYGSNLNTKVLVGRRGVKAESAKPCVVNGYSLEFAMPGAFGKLYVD
jgi:hypothetical protein